MRKNFENVGEEAMLVARRWAVSTHPRRNSQNYLFVRIESLSVHACVQGKIRLL